MHCANCGSEILPGKRFCHACGARVVVRCAACGAAVEPGFRFCPDCGLDLTAAPVSAVPPTPPADPMDRLSRQLPSELAEKIRATQGTSTGERKLVTVLFCDLVGSTAISEQLDPEEYRELLDQYLEIAFREIYRVEGIVNQLAGDGMMALFGAPIAHEDAPQRALQAALAIRTVLGDFSERSRFKDRLALRVRVGVNTGPVVVGAVGNDLKMDYTAIGDTTNLAARLQSLAEPGAIFISESTYRQARGAFEIRAAGRFEIKGKSEPVAVYEVLGVRDTSAPMAIAEARGLTPFIGRQEELAQLVACYERLSGSLPQAVAIVGDAGSGKSRLVYEFRQRVEAEAPIVMEARCSALTQAVPYAPFVAMLRQFFGLEAGETVSCACGKAASRLREYEGVPAHVYPYLCHLLSLPAEGIAQRPAEERKRETFEAVADLVLALSRRAPVVMIIEDLHWIDDGTREMLEMAMAGLHRARLMLLVTHRRDYRASWSVTAAFTQLNLRALEDAEVAEIVRAVVGARLPPELERLIVAKAEGNPFFAEEMTRALVEEGHVLRADGAARLTRPIEQISIPATVEELISARLDRLGAHGKRALQVASVLGRQFRRSHVAAVLENEHIDAGAQIEEIERRGLVRRLQFLDGDVYRFGESLTQEVAYETLLLKERRRLHERIGLMMEAAPGEDTAERFALLAHHFVRAERHEKAIEALLRAAAHAEGLPSFRAAADFYRQAWKTLEAVPPASLDGSDALRRAAIDAATNLCRLGIMYGLLDDAETERVASRGQQIAEALGHKQAVASFYSYRGLAVAEGQRSRFDEGLAMIERGHALAHESGSERFAMNLSRALAWTYLMDGRFAEAVENLAAVVGKLERSGERDRLTDLYLGTRWMLDASRYFSDDLEGAMRSLPEVHQLAVQAPNRTVQASAAAGIASIHLDRGEFAEAKRWADTAVDIAEAIGNLSALHSAAAVALAAHFECGDSSGTGRLVQLMEQGGAPRGDTILKCHLAIDTLLALGETARARRLGEMAYAMAGGRFREAVCSLALAKIDRHSGPAAWPQARLRFDRAIELAREVGSRSLAAAALLGRAELMLAMGDRADLSSAIDEASGLWHEIGVTRCQRRADDLRRELQVEARQRA